MLYRFSINNVTKTDQLKASFISIIQLYKFKTPRQYRRGDREEEEKTSIYSCNVTHQKEKGKKKWLKTQNTAFASDTSSRINGPSLSSNELPRPYGILNALRILQTAALSDPPSHSHLFILLVNPVRVKYKAHWTSVKRCWEGKKIKELEIMKWDKIKQDI